MGKYRILILCLASFIASAAVSWGVFEAMPHLEDEHANYFQARVFAAGRVVNPAHTPEHAFFVPFAVVQDGKQFSKYTPGYALVLALGMLVGQPWLVNALAAALGILATYLLGRDLFDRHTGLLAAALGVISPTYLLLSGTFLAHTATLAVLAFFAWAFLRARRPEEERREVFALAAGGLMGLALSMRPWTAVAIGLPFAILALFDLIRRREAALPVTLRMAVLFAVVAAIVPLYTQAATGSPFTNTYKLWWAYDTVGFGPEIGRNGHTWAKAMINIAIDFPNFSETFLGWPVWLGVPLAWLVVGLGMALPPRHKYEWMLLVPPAVLIVAHLAYWAHSGGLYGTRYYAEGMPFLWILAARGLLKFATSYSRLRLVQVILPVMVLWGIFFVTLPRFLQGRGLYNITRADARTVTQAGIQNALVFVHTQYWTDYASLSWLNPPDLEAAEVVFARDMGPNTNAEVIRQFPGRSVYLYNRYQPQALSAYPDESATQ